MAPRGDYTCDMKWSVLRLCRPYEIVRSEEWFYRIRGGIHDAHHVGNRTDCIEKFSSFQKFRSTSLIRGKSLLLFLCVCAHEYVVECIQYYNNTNTLIADP